MKRLTWLLLLTLPLPAFALNMDYYTYDGFQETVDAFTRLALVMSDTAFNGFAFTFIVAGILLAGLTVVFKVHGGQAINPIAPFIPVFAGAILYLGFIVPTGTMFIYDPVINANQAVGGVPNLVTMLAGTLNELERDVVTVISTGSANPYDTTGGMLQFNLLMAAMGAQPDDTALSKSFEDYYTQCGTFAMSQGYSGVSMQELRRGSSDLMTTFGKFSDPAVSAVYYTDTNPAGSVVSCDQDWTVNLEPQIATMTASMQQMENEVCKKAGFDPTQAVQLAACDNNMGNVSQLMGIAGGTALTFLRSVFLAQTVSSAMHTGQYQFSQSQVLDRQVMVESLGSAASMNEWIPKLRAFMTAVVIGLVPLCVLFMLTPLCWKALALLSGLFFWLFFWGISDAIAAQMSSDAAVNAFAQIGHYNLGYDAIVNSPEGAVKALGIFGKARMMGLVLSTLLSGSLMHFGGLGLANLSQNWSRDIEGKGESAGRTSYLPETRGQFEGSFATARASEMALGQGGLQNVAGGQAMGMARSASTFREQSVSSRMSGEPPLSLSRYLGEKDAGENIAERDSYASRGVGGYEAGAFSGSLRAANQLTEREIAANLNPDLARGQNGYVPVTPESTLQTARLEHGATIAQSTVTPKGQDAIDVFAQQDKKQLAGGQYLERTPGSAERIGRIGEEFSNIGATGDEAALGTTGFRSLAAGEQFSKEQGGASANAARAADGSTKRFATDTAATEAAQRLGNSQAARTIAGYFGLNPSSVADLTEVANRRGLTQVSIPLDRGNQDHILGKLVQDGQLTQAKADEVKRSGFGGTVLATIEPDGATVTSALQVGRSDAISDSSTIQKVDTRSDERGSRTDVFDTSTLNVSKTLQGGAAFLQDSDALRVGVSKAFGGSIRDGLVNNNFTNQLAGQIGETVRSYGYALNAGTATDFQKAIRGGIEGNLGVGVGGESPVSAGASVSAGGSAQKLWSQTTSSNTDSAVTFGRNLISNLREDAISKYKQHYGVAAYQNDDPKLVERRLESYIAGGLQRGTSALVEASEDRAKSSNRNRESEDAQKTLSQQNDPSSKPEGSW